jgi:hypothetical protein
VWVAGWWRLARDPALRTWRSFAVAYVVLAAVFLLSRGKPYYLAGLYPVLLAAGAAPVLAWVTRKARRVRGALVGAALALTLTASALLMLPLVPVDELAGTPVVALNYDAGETVGWPEYAATLAHVRAGLPADARVAVLTADYRQAGAVDRFLPALAPAHSGHNAYADWGPPPEDAESLIVVGFRDADLRRWFGDAREVARVDNAAGVDNDLRGTPVHVVRDRLLPWAALWPQLRRLG